MMDGMRIGHFSDFDSLTGCTVFLFDKKNRAIASVRGGAPGSRELNALSPGQLVENVDAVVFTGGSALGLRSMEGVVKYLQERGKGYQTQVTVIPMVAGAVIYDLEIGKCVAPLPEWGYQACVQANEHPEEGSVGAGTGATVGKVAGMKWAMKSGFGTGDAVLHGGSIQSYVVTNALGDIYDPESGDILAGRRNPQGKIVGLLRETMTNHPPSSPLHTT
ncbi:MAG: P1 family peptidase, partial [Atribacterota bacterium]